MELSKNSTVTVRPPSSETTVYRLPNKNKTSVATPTIVEVATQYILD